MPASFGRSIDQLITTSPSSSWRIVVSTTFFLSLSLAHSLARSVSPKPLSLLNLWIIESLCHRICRKNPHLHPAQQHEHYNHSHLLRSLASLAYDIFDGMNAYASIYLCSFVGLCFFFSFFVFFFSCHTATIFLTGKCRTARILLDIFDDLIGRLICLRFLSVVLFSTLHESSAADSTDEMIIHRAPLMMFIVPYLLVRVRSQAKIPIGRYSTSREHSQFAF